MDFKNKVVLILGGTGDIGSAIADSFQKSGAHVCRHGLQNGDYRADLRESEETAQLIKKVVDDFGRIDILVNSVSFPVTVSRFEKKHWSDFLNHLNIQLKAAVETAQYVLPIMKERRWGRIIHILTSYTNGAVPSSISDYITAKYALLGFTKALAKEAGKHNITVNAVSPSFIKDGFTKDIPEKLSEMIMQETPLGRLATPQDVAHAVLFLASDEAGFITGENLGVTGGNNV